MFQVDLVAYSSSLSLKFRLKGKFETVWCNPNLNSYSICHIVIVYEHLGLYTIP